MKNVRSGMGLCTATAIPIRSKSMNKNRAGKSCIGCIYIVEKPFDSFTIWIIHSNHVILYLYFFPVKKVKN